MNADDCPSVDENISIHMRLSVFICGSSIVLILKFKLPLDRRASHSRGKVDSSDLLLRVVTS